MRGSTASHQRPGRRGSRSVPFETFQANPAHWVQCRSDFARRCRSAGLDTLRNGRCCWTDARVIGAANRSATGFMYCN